MNKILFFFLDREIALCEDDNHESKIQVSTLDGVRDPGDGVGRVYAVLVRCSNSVVIMST